MHLCTGAARSMIWLMTAGAVWVALSTLNEMPASAQDDQEAHKVTRIAAVGGGEPKTFALEPGFAVPGKQPAIDLRVLLAQNGHAVQSDAAGDEVLVALPLSTEESVDEEIAKQHGLELVERKKLEALGLRVIRYRALGHRPVAPIIAQLNGDPRVSNAQVNAQYNIAPTPGAPAIETSSLKDGAPVTAKADIKPGAGRRSHLQSAKAIGPADRQRANETANPPQPVRVGRAGDILAGGL